MLAGCGVYVWGKNVLGGPCKGSVEVISGMQVYAWIYLWRRIHGL